MWLHEDVGYLETVKIIITINCTLEVLREKKHYRQTVKFETGNFIWKSNLL